MMEIGPTLKYVAISFTLSGHRSGVVILQKNISPNLKLHRDFLWGELGEESNITWLVYLRFALQFLREVW